MNYILRTEDDKVVDVFEIKKELLDFTRKLLNEFNNDMLKNETPEECITYPIETVGDCENVLYGFGYRIELR